LIYAIIFVRFPLSFNKFYAFLCSICLTYQFYCFIIESTRYTGVHGLTRKVIHVQNDKITNKTDKKSALSLTESIDLKYQDINADVKTSVHDFLLFCKPVVKDCIAPYFIAGGDDDDLFQEGMIALYKALISFDSSISVPFLHYARLCVSNHIKSTIKNSLRLKHQPLNSYTTLDDTETGLKKQILSPEEKSDPLYIYLRHEELEAVRCSVDRDLSPFERKVLGLYIGDYSYSEIADIVQKPVKSVDNAMQRIKKKLTSLLQN